MRRREFIALVGGQRCGRCLHLWNDWKAERCSPFFTVAGGCARLHWTCDADGWIIQLLA